MKAKASLGEVNHMGRPQPQDSPSDTGDEQALDISKAYREHGAFIGRSIMRLTGRGPHVDDLLQETFIIAFRRRASFEPDRTLIAWLYGIAANLCRRYRRGLARFARAETRLRESHRPPSHPSLDAKLDEKKRAALVHQALSKLPFKQREVFVLYEIEGLEGAQIAGMLDIAEGTVWTRLHHARKKMTKSLRQRAALEEER